MSDIRYMNKDNPFGLDNESAIRKIYIEKLLFAVENNHVFAVIPYHYSITDDTNKNLPNWRVNNDFGNASLCSKMDIKDLRIKIHNFYNYEEILENNTLCEQCKEVLKEYIKEFIKG